MEDPDEAPLAVALSEDSHGEAHQQAKHIPVTLITGFLGSGKSTLVRHILKERHGYRLAVIVNEYGESVEGSQFKTPDGGTAEMGEWVELSNGCMCCAVKSEFVQAIEALMLKKAKFDHILIETTGLANPGPVAAALWTDEELEAGVQLDCIVTVVDAINIDRQLNDLREDGVANEAQVQVAYADIILLNKMDLAAEEAVERAEADIRAINSSVQILRTSHCQVDLRHILHREGYGRNADLEVISEEQEGEEEPPVAAKQQPQPTPKMNRSHSKRQGSMHRGHERPHGTDSRASHLDPHFLEGEGHSEDGHTHAMHDRTIQTTTLRSDAPLDKEKFKGFIDRLLWDREAQPEDVYRIKGNLNFVGSETKHFVQAVYELYSITEGPAWTASDARSSTVVVIGRNLKMPQLHEWFEECVVA